MTDDELKAIEARAEAATKGPWGAYCIPRGQYPMYGIAQTMGDKLVVCDMSGVDAPEANANHIAHSRTDTPALCAEVRCLKGQVRRLRRERAKVVGVPTPPHFLQPPGHLKQDDSLLSTDVERNK